MLQRLLRRTTERDRPLAKVSDVLHSRERFRDLLQVERMRADRCRSHFSLVVLSLPKDAGAADRVAFARYLDRRRRATDHLGEMNDSHLGVILWDTAEEGAWNFARSAVDHWHGPSQPACEVYVYPTYQAPPKPSPDASQQDAGSDDESENGPGPGEAKPAGEEVAGSTPAECDTKPMEALFVQRLPAWKRAIDVAGAAFGLLVLSPLLLATAALIKLTSRGPVFFVQWRDGLGGQPFRIYKFRTMYVDAEARKAELRKYSEQDGPCFKMEHDPRITPLGRFLRKSCIDELPQLWNVLIGDMTLVGPRPLDCKESQYTSGWERRRLEITPGLTCIWQVEGKSKVSFAEWMRMDIRYSKARTFLQDVRLVWRTFVSVLLHRASH